MDPNPRNWIASVNLQISKLKECPNGKKLRDLFRLFLLLGNFSVFKYDPSNRNVVVVDSGGYNSCQALTGAKVHTSVNDQINLVKGGNCFLCSFEGHCESGMKIAVNAS
ncbi:hypothetical protein ACJRO7_026074 [Eucalyptus globulus]|uniref:Phytocyanin domain-containing protein n=1 Tax=Eucalyptus globulus TaxID=34317 RepID=A0ABD3KDV8_EUCGL